MSSRTAQASRMAAHAKQACLNDVWAVIGKPPIQFGEKVKTEVITDTPYLDRVIAGARRDMGEQKWAELNAEWERPL